ncbi:MAG: DUF4159 domain-containing protein [Planctomycetota bacterium]|jgi:hypothetical protein
MDPIREHMDRRTFLKKAGRTVAAASMLTSGLCSAYEQTVGTGSADDLNRYDFLFPRVKFTEKKIKGGGKGPDVWNVRPGGDANLLRALESVIRCKVKPVEGANDWEPQYAREGQLNAVATFDNLEETSEYPFLFMTGENYFEFTDKQENNLREYIMRGGFLFMDDCVVGSGGDFFYQSSFQMLERIFGRGAVKRVPQEHEIFHNVYDLGQTGLPSMEYVNRRRPRGLPYMHGQNHGARAVFVEDRIAVFLSSTDIHCGWCDSFGIEWGRDNHEKAIQMGINIIMYALSH